MRFQLEKTGRKPLGPRGLQYFFPQLKPSLGAWRQRRTESAVNTLRGSTLQERHLYAVILQLLSIFSLDNSLSLYHVRDLKIS
jgi:hypothetical protein